MAISCDISMCSFSFNVKFDNTLSCLAFVGTVNVVNVFLSLFLYELLSDFNNHVK